MGMTADFQGMRHNKSVRDTQDRRLSGTPPASGFFSPFELLHRGRMHWRSFLLSRASSTHCKVRPYQFCQKVLEVVVQNGTWEHAVETPSRQNFAIYGLDGVNGLEKYLLTKSEYYTGS
jgi:hypothetical protein